MIKISKKMKEDFDEMEDIESTFATSDRPDTYSDMKEASRMAKKFNRLLTKYMKILHKLPGKYRAKIEELNKNNSVYDPEDDF